MDNYYTLLPRDIVIIILSFVGKQIGNNFRYSGVINEYCVFISIRCLINNIYATERGLYPIHKYNITIPPHSSKFPWKISYAYTPHWNLTHPPSLPDYYYGDHGQKAYYNTHNHKLYITIHNKTRKHKLGGYVYKIVFADEKSIVLLGDKILRIYDAMGHYFDFSNARVIGKILDFDVDCYGNILIIDDRGGIKVFSTF